MNIHKHKVTGAAVAIAVLGAITYVGATGIYGRPAAYATDTPAVTAGTFNFAVFKSAFIKNTDSKSKWSDGKGNEVARINAAITTLEKHIPSIAELKLGDLTPRATQMAVLNDIANYVQTSTIDLVPSVIVDEAKASIELHKATRTLIDIFVTRDDATKKDTWKLQDNATEKVVAAYEGIYTTEKGKEILDASGFSADFTARVHAAGKLQPAIEKAFSKLDGQKSKKTSTAILTAIKDEIEAVAYSTTDADAVALATLSTGDAAQQVSAVIIPGATATNRHHLRIAAIANSNATITAILKDTENTAAGFDIDIVDATGQSVQPQEAVAITLKLSGDLKALFDTNKTVKLYHVMQDGKKEEVVYTRQKDTVSFKATSFSPYVFVAENTASPAAPANNAEQTPQAQDTDTTTTEAKDTKGGTGLADTGSVYTLPVIAGIVATGLGAVLLVKRS